VTNTPRRWVLASGNSGKLSEIQALLAPSSIEVLPQSEFGVESIEETSNTFVENALLKARHVAAATSLPTIADDSGLVVDALAGAPGINSARFAGPDNQDYDNVTKLLALLEDVADEKRSAQFYCVIVALVAPQNPFPLIGSGIWPGLITRKPRGELGFGYDPVFFDPELKATAAELPSEVKNRVSHRGRALSEIQFALATLPRKP
jgi:XTP/dITP diphosphohydrolase